MKSIDELEHDHRVIEQAVELLARVASHVSDERAFAFGTWAVEFFQRFADACHHRKEEEALFPLLEARGIPDRGGPIGLMLLEHSEGRGLVAEMQKAVKARDLPAFVASAGAYAGLLRAHIAKERGVLFPMGASRLSDEDDRQLTARFAAIERAGGGEALHARFHAELARWQRELGSAAAETRHEAAPAPRE